MSPESRFCRQCNHTFRVDAEDLAFYEKIAPNFAGKTFPIPTPSLCSACREQSRLVWRNEHKLYNRKCDLTGKDIISVHASDKSYPVYSSAAWWSDAWDPITYGKDFDFSRPFFDQYCELINQVPRAALYNVDGENSEYNQSTGNLKNCYLLAGANYDEDCYYGKYIHYSRNCVDTHMLDHCELCYESIDCKSCYNCSFIRDCTNCRDSQFLYACHNCNDCFGCINLSNKQYCFFNEQLSPEDYKNKIATADLSKHSTVIEIKKKMEEKLLEHPVRYMNGTSNENCTGDCLSQSKNSHYCFDASQLENCKYCVYFHQAKDCMDVFAWGMPAELSYYSMEVGGGAYQVLFSVTCFSSQNLLYCFQCHNSSHCFGCSGLKGRQYCILNKQYTKDEYEKVVASIIEHMMLTKEWGEFFPLNFSGFGYNETAACEQYPSTKDTVLSLGGLWHDEEPIKLRDRPIIPDDINEANEGICQQTLYCESCSKPYRIINQELAFYRRQSIPIPRQCFSCRHIARLKKRPNHYLSERNCSKCDAPIVTAYDSIRPIYCESCYQKFVY